MGNANGAEEQDPLAGMSSEPMLSPDGSCQHINRAISILLMDRTIANRSMINKAQCICYYCNPLSRLVFCRGGRKDILANRSVKLAFNFNLKGTETATPQHITNSYRRLFYGADANTMQKVLSTRRFFSRGTKFVVGDSGELVEDVNDQYAQVETIQYICGIS
jgi:hypothetical protein